MIEFTCECGKALKAQPEIAGRKCRCPKCGLTMPVPTPDPLPAPEPHVPPEVAPARGKRPAWMDPIPGRVWVRDDSPAVHADELASAAGLSGPVLHSSGWGHFEYVPPPRKRRRRDPKPRPPDPAA